MEWKTACGCCNCVPTAFVARRGTGAASFTNCSNGEFPFTTADHLEMMVLCPWEDIPGLLKQVLRCSCWCSAWKDWGKNGKGWKKCQSKEPLWKCFWKDKAPNPAFTNSAKLLQDWASPFLFCYHYTDFLCNWIYRFSVYHEQNLAL